MLLSDEVLSLLGLSLLLPPAPVLKRTSEELGDSHLSSQSTPAQQAVTLDMCMSANISQERKVIKNRGRAAEPRHS